jgi:hypothetical protein
LFLWRWRRYSIAGDMFHVSSTKDQCLFQGQGYDVGVIAKAGIFPGDLAGL